MAGGTDDLLRRAREETDSALTPGACCDPRLEGLRSQIVALLSCDACQDISIKVENVHVTGSLYRSVAQALANPRHRIHLKVAKELRSNNRANAAEYDPRANRITLTFDAIAGKPDALAQQCQSIVHECTHAALDLARVSTWRSTNELAAWFAGVLFLKGQSLPVDDLIDFRKNLSLLADGARHANAHGSVYVMPSAAVASLKKDILSAYGYKDFMETGDGV